MRARYNFPAPSWGSAEDADVAQRQTLTVKKGLDSFCTLHFGTVLASHQKENPAAGDGRGFRTIGRLGIGGLGGRPSPLVARHPDQVQSGSTLPEFWFVSSGLPQSRPNRLAVEGRTRDLALFNLAIDSKLRGCDVVALKVERSP
jgi:hypothetical protein